MDEQTTPIKLLGTIIGGLSPPIIVPAFEIVTNILYCVFVYE